MAKTSLGGRQALDEGRGAGRRVRRLASAHPARTAAGIVVLLALAAFVLVWFQPQKLFLDARVDEALPGATAEEPDVPASGARGGEAPDARGPAVLAAGPFRSLEHETTGTAKILGLADGRRFLRLEGFETSNGPDLRVFLSEIPAGDDWFAYGKRFVDLGALKGNVGDQNYELPPDLDLDRYRSAVIWCRRFSVGFGVAPLEPRRPGRT